MRDYISRTFATHAGLPMGEIFEADLSLAEIVKRSPHMTNSVDLMEAFAKTANAIKRDHGRRVRLPTFTLDTRISVVLQAIVAQLEEEVSRAG